MMKTNWVVLLAAGCKPVVAKQVRWATRGSIPSRPTRNMARSFNGRMRDPQSRDTGSIPVRATDMAKWWNWDTRGAQNAVPARACEFDSRLGYFIADAAGAQLAFIRPVSPARYRDLQLAGGPVPIEVS